MTRIANNSLTKARDAADAALLYKEPEYTATKRYLRDNKV